MEKNVEITITIVYSGKNRVILFGTTCFQILLHRDKRTEANVQVQPPFISHFLFHVVFHY